MTLVAPLLLDYIQTRSASLWRWSRRVKRVGDEGGEPAACSPQKTPFSQQGGAESGALFGDDERLRVLLQAWADLPESVKDALLVMVGDRTC